MATIKGYDSASLGMLFSGLNQKSSQTSRMGGMDLLGINYSDYATIRSGSYRKIMNAYYENGKNIQGVTDNMSTGTSKDDVKKLARLEEKAGAMRDSAGALLAVGKKSLFEKVEVKDKDGVSKMNYDTDAIYQAIDQFTKDYNSLLDEAAGSNTKNVLRTASAMVNYSKVNEKLLAKVGIKIGADNKLSVNEEVFKKADMGAVKSLFQERGSYGYQIGAQASLMNSYAKSEAIKSNTYGNTGMYTYNYNAGKLYNTGI